MHVVDIISWTIMGAVAAVLIIACIALIILAFRWDDMGEEYWEEYWGKDEEECADEIKIHRQQYKYAAGSRT